MNTSLRYTALALLLAFAGSQVCAMTNDADTASTLAEAGSSAMTNTVVDSLTVILESQEEANKAAAELKKQGYFDSAFARKDELVKFTKDFLAKNPSFLKYTGIVAAVSAVGTVTLYLVGKKRLYKLWEGSKALVVKTAKKVKDNPGKTAIGGALAIATGMALLYAKDKNIISPFSATLGTFLASNGLIQSMYDKLPSMQAIKDWFTVRNIGNSLGLTSALGTLYIAKRNASKAALPAAPAQQAPAVKQVEKPAPKQVQAPVQKKSWGLPSLPSFGNSKKQLEAAAKEAAQKQTQELAKQQAEQRAAQQLADLKTAQTIAKNEFVKAVLLEVNKNKPGQFTGNLSAQIDQVSNAELINAHKNFVATKTTQARHALCKILEQIK